MSAVRRTIVGMWNREKCETCEGSGASARQWLSEDEIRVCIDCEGDGFILVYADEQLVLKAG